MGPGANPNALAGGLYGLLVGDAVGVPYEFRISADLPELEQIEMTPPRGFRRSHPRAPKGAWSDDGAQALCLLASLLHCDALDTADLSRRLVDWFDSGYMAVDGVVFDVGHQTSAALSALRNGVSPEKSGLAGEEHNGNGSLMRVLPLALWHKGSDAELIRDAGRQSAVTHAHARSQVSCALYCLWVRAELHGIGDSWGRATQTLRAFCANNPVWADELERNVRPDDPPRGSGLGYVVDCLNSARLAAEEPSYERAIRRAVSLGNDTDTTAAVAGGFVGVRYGLESIPRRWLLALSGRDIADPLVQRMLAGWGPTHRTE
jgi:ADP-ribosylglycohydrolase